MVLDDETAAAHATDLSERTAPIRYELAREQLRVRAATDATLEHHRALFLARQQVRQREQRR